MSTTHDLKTLAAPIIAAWTKSKEAIFEAALHCARADAFLTPAQKADLIKELPFEAPTFSKLVQVGNDPRLTRPEVQCLLPASYSIAYAVSQLDDRQLAHAISAGVLNPGAKREEIEACRKKVARSKPATLPFGSIREKPASGRPSNWVQFAQICVPVDFTLESSEALAEELLSVAERHGVEFIRIMTYDERLKASYERKIDRYYRQCEAEGRRIVRKRIKDMKSARKAESRPVGFFPDEILIRPNAGWDEIQEVMQFLGIEDEFAGIRESVEQSVEFPDAPELSEDTESDIEFVGLPPAKYPPDTYTDWK